jgi:hydroxymethylpyrimidine pyrophosphatase-like HAD family hydrolase
MFVAALDIDGTQYSFARPDWDAASHELASTLKGMRDEEKVFVVHNTGRPYPWKCHGDIDERFLNPIIAESDAIISHAGTVIWLPPFTTPLKEWRDHILTIVQPETVQQVINDLTAAGVALHPESFDNEFKISCLLDPARQEETVQWLRDHLVKNYGDKFDVFYWNSNTADITPKGASKNDALRFLVNHQGLESAKIFAAGDAFNDLPVLCNGDYLRVVTGNAHAGVRREVEKTPGDFFFTEANQPAAAGVLAGLRHFGLIAPSTRPRPKFGNGLAL